MSNEAINWAFHQQVPMARKFVLIVLANYADENHSCFPGQKKIAEKIGASVETVRRALVELEKEGLVLRERRNRESGYRSSDRYFLPVNLPTGQFACKAESGVLPVNLPTPTGQSEGANYTLVNTSGKPKSSSNRHSRIRDDFTPSDSSLVWAQENVPDIDLELETKQFIDHHAGKGSMMVSWDRAWMTWMRNQQRWSKPKAAARPPARTTSDKMRATIEMGRRLQGQQNGIAS